MLQKRSNIFLILASAVLTLLGMLSCDNGCEQIRESFMRITFTSTSSRSLTGITIDAHGRREGVADSDSNTIQYTTGNLTKYESIELELNPQDSIVTFILRSQYSDYGDRFGVNDTVRIAYTANGRFLDMECGCTVDYEIKNVTHTKNLIQDVQILAPQIHTESGINLEFIY